MSFIKCPSCGNEIQKESAKCIYCGFDMTHYERDTKIKIVVQDPNTLPLGGKTINIYNRKTDEWIAEAKLGDIFYITINEPTTISVKKTAWKTGHITLRAKPNATYKIIFKTGFLTSRILIKDITDAPNEVCDNSITDSENSSE